MHVRKSSNHDRDFRCHRCSTSNIVAKNVHLMKMYYYNRCKLHICEKCCNNGRTVNDDKHRDRLKEVQL